MNSRVNTVVIVLILSCLASVCKTENEVSIEGRKSNRFTSIKLPAKTSTKIPRIRTNGIKLGAKHSSKLGQGSKKPLNKLSISKAVLQSPKAAELRGPGKHKKSMNRYLMALLMAYKLKFAALIPTMIGGLILLMSTTALAGFFFALFAAILGLKGQ